MARRIKSLVWLVAAVAAAAAAAADQQDRTDDGKIKAAPSHGVLMVGFLGVFERRVT
jgi:hypothetical protein